MGLESKLPDGVLLQDVHLSTLQFVPADRVLPSTNCGMAPMDREVARRKLEALAKGAALVRGRS